MVNALYELRILVRRLLKAPGFTLAFALTLALSVLTALIVALVPTWRLSRVDPQQALKEDGAGAGESPRLRRVREGLVILGAAMAMVLLAGTGLMTRSVQRLLKVDRGFDPAGKVALWIDLPRPLQEAEARHGLVRRLESALAATPGVRGVCTSNTVPMNGTSATNLVKPDGSTLVAGLGCAWGLTRFLRSLLFETSALDPWVYLTTSALLMVCAGLACWIPARRAALANPADLLRSE